jgi:NAD+ dependent glucose-6-phosphate dehydrogenase
MVERLRVLVTGASGYLASLLLPVFRERYVLRLTDVTDRDSHDRPVRDVVCADLAADRTACGDLFEGIDAVVHLAHKHPGHRPWGTDVPPLDRFDAELLNIKMAQTVYRCAYERGVRRVVMASSNHAADWYEHTLIHSGRRDLVSPSDLPLSDNFYGWAKASYELLGFAYACGGFGRKLEVIQIRVGAPRDVAGHHYESELREWHTGPGTSNLANFKRELGAYISERDLAQLFERAIETLNVENEYGVPWLIVYGISNNTRAFWSLENARRVLGYEPVDDSEVKYADDVTRLLTGRNAKAAPGRVGG